MQRASFEKAVMAAARVACAAALVGCGIKPAPDTAAEDTAMTHAPGDTAQGACELAVADGIDLDDAECCQEIAEYYDAISLAGLEDWAERDACCELLGWDGSMACTPWGPPCPPKMPEVA